MIEKNIDFWEELKSGYDAAICTTNQVILKSGELCLGGGIALEFKNRFPQLGKIWAEEVKNGYSCLDTAWENVKGNKSIIVTPQDDLRDYVADRELSNFDICYPVNYLVALPTKQHFKDPSPEWLVKRSCEHLLIVANALGWTRILCPRMGCGLGGLQWDNIRKVVSFLDDRFTIVHKE